MTTTTDQTAHCMPSQVGFFQRIFKAQLITGSIALLGLLVMVSVTLHQAKATSLMAEQLEPSVRAADRILLGINRSVAALRGWVTLGDSNFLAEWDRAWKKDINPAQARLAAEALAVGGQSGPDGLTALLRNLRESQWWVKDVARTLGNERARFVQEAEILPLTRSIERKIEARIEILKRSVDAVDQKRAVVLSELLRMFGNSYFLLDDFLDNGSPHVKQQLFHTIARIRDFFEQHRLMAIALQGHPSPLLVTSQRDFDAYIEIMARTIRLREAPDWNLSLYLLSTTTLPMAERASTLARSLSRTARTLLRQEAEAGVQASDFAVMMALVITVLMVISTLTVSWLLGKRLTRPVAKLAKAARRFSRGKLGKNIPVPSITELAELTQAFNHMRNSLNKAINDLHQSNTSLERRSAELNAVNRELESFAYSVAHDLRAPLRAIDGFSLALLESCGEQLDSTAKDYLGYLRESSQEMGHLIDVLLKLSRVTRSEISCEDIDLSQLAVKAIQELKQSDPERHVETDVKSGIRVNGDQRLLQAVMENLLGNAWKFTAREAEAHIEVGAAFVNGKVHCFVRDNGAGFDMAYQNKLFVPFKRLHSRDDFEGAGIGLSTVQRIISRHGGTIHAEGHVGKGACFTFELSTPENNHE